MTVTIEKQWDANECVTERGRRVYVSRGRWQWVLIIDGVVYDAYDTRRAARQVADRRVAAALADAELALQTSKDAERVDPSAANKRAVIAAWNARAVLTPRRAVSGFASRAGRRQRAELNAGGAR